MSIFKKKRNITEDKIAEIIEASLESDYGKAISKRKNLWTWLTLAATVLYLFVYVFTAYQVIRFLDSSLSFDKYTILMCWIIFSMCLLAIYAEEKNVFQWIENSLFLLSPVIIAFVVFVYSHWLFDSTAKLPIVSLIICILVFSCYLTAKIVLFRTKRKELQMISAYAEDYYEIPYDKENGNCENTYRKYLRTDSYCKIAYVIIISLFIATFFIPFIEILGEKVSIFTFLKESIQKGFALIQRKETEFFFSDMFFEVFKEIEINLFGHTSNGLGLGEFYLLLIAFAAVYSLIYGITTLVQAICAPNSKYNPKFFDYIYLSKKEILQRSQATKFTRFYNFPLLLIGLSLALGFITIPAYLHFKFYMALTNNHLGGVDEALYSVSPMLLWIPLLLYLAIFLFPLIQSIFMNRNDEAKSALWHLPLRRKALWSKYQKRK